MKRFLTSIICFILCLTAGCSSKSPQVTEVEYHGQLFVVNATDCTISDGKHIYHYRTTSSRDSHSTHITYPNGSTYYSDTNGSFSSSGWSEDYDEDLYVSGQLLLHILDLATPPKQQRGHPFLCFLFVALGIWHVVSPYSVWYFRHGWRYKDAEPSDAALTWTRISGFICIVIGIYVMFV